MSFLIDSSIYISDVEACTKLGKGHPIQAPKTGEVMLVETLSNTITSQNEMTLSLTLRYRYMYKGLVSTFV